MKVLMEKSNLLEERVDRVSNLPDDILHDILSSLHMFDVVQLSMLSTRWNYLWRTMPYLNFDINSFGRERIRRRHWHWVFAEKFKEFINWILISQRTNNLVCFTLCCDDMLDKGDIFRWVHVATTRNVQELVLSFRLAEPFELPYCESLRVLNLTLHGSILKLPNHFGFNQLKLFHLVEVELSNETSCLFSKCPVLEKLILRNCSFGTMTVLDIASTSLVYVALVCVKMGESYRSCNVKISCPNLKVLKYQAPEAKDIIIENLFSIEVVHIYFKYNMDDQIEEVGLLALKMIKNVPSTSALKLCLDSVMGLYTASRELRNFPVTFYKLKSLKMRLGIEDELMQVMMLLLKHSPNLEVLNLFSSENYGWDKNLKLHDPIESIACLESHLKSIKLTDFKYEENEMELLRFFLKNAQVLEKLIIVWDFTADYDIAEEALEEVSKFPKASSDVVVTFLDYNPNLSSCYRHW